MSSDVALGPFENGLATVGSKRGRLHLMRPGGGVVCMPNTPFERLAPTHHADRVTTCGRCQRLTGGAA